MPVWMHGGRLRVRFAEPQRAVTPGQFAVLYDGEARALAAGSSTNHTATVVTS